MYIPAATTNLYNSPRFQARKLFTEQTRIKRKPPKTTSADETVGLLCWGTVGDLPSAEAVPMVDVETHTEVSRETTQVRIENPDDPSQYVDALQTNKMKLTKTVPAEINNSATADADLSKLDTKVQAAVQPSTGGTKDVDYTVTYKPPERAL